MGQCRTWYSTSQPRLQLLLWQGTPPQTAVASNSKFFLFPWSGARQGEASLGTGGKTMPHRKHLTQSDPCHFYSHFTTVHICLWPSWLPGSQGTASCVHGLLRRGRSYKTTAQAPTGSRIAGHSRGEQGREAGIVLSWFTPEQLDNNLVPKWFFVFYKSSMSGLFVWISQTRCDDLYQRLGASQPQKHTV